MKKYDFSDFDEPKEYDFSDFDDSPSVSSTESGIRGAAQGLSLGFADEITGGIEALKDIALTDKELSDLGDVYSQRRDESRLAYKQAEEANPGSYMTGQVGGSIASAFIPGLNVAKGASLAGRAGIAAAQGGLVGLGTSEADNVSDAALDTIKGAGMNAAFQGVGEKVISPLLSKAGNVISKGIDSAKPYVTKGISKSLSKTANILSNLDEDSAEFYLKNPKLSEAMELDGAAYGLGKEIEDSIYETGSEVGKNVNRAQTEFLKKYKDEYIPGVRDQLKESLNEFLEINAPSRKGFSALSMKEQETLSTLMNTISGDNFTGEDLVKFRGLIDNGMKVARKYDQEGVGPYMNYLKNLRYQADNFLDTVSPSIDTANKAYSQFKDDESLLKGFTRAGQLESATNNLFGANKKAQQEAAKRILSKDQYEKAQALMYNKASDAQGPAGSRYGLRNLVSAATFIPSFGLSTVVTDPNAWKAGLRTIGKVEDKISYILKNNPNALGKFSQPLKKALDRGALSLSATHFILQQQDPDYRKTIEDLDKE
jgi:hypothetical protein